MKYKWIEFEKPIPSITNTQNRQKWTNWFLEILRRYVEHTLIVSCLRDKKETVIGTDPEGVFVIGRLSIPEEEWSLFQLT